MARLSLAAAKALSATPALLLAAALSACGMPQPSAPPAPPDAAAEGPPQLLGGPPVELAQAEPSEPDPLAAASLQARRPGWGTMAPIPNPPEGAVRLRASASEEVPRGPAPYRLIGPTLPDAYARSGPSLRPDNRPGAVQGARIVAASPGARARSGKPRIRHWIIPAASPE